MTSTLETLQKARDLISDPKRWTQGAFARDTLGRDLFDAGEEDFEPVCFCSLGALAHVSGLHPDGTLPGESTLAEVIAKDLGLPPEIGFVPDFNDTHTHAEVLAAFDAAIEKARAAE